VYITVEQLKAYIQEQLVTQGLDDADQGVADSVLFDTIETAVEREIHSYLEARYPVPFRTNIPNLVIHAALVLHSEAIWTRRGNTGDNNPFTKAAESVRSMLDDVRTNKQPLSRDQAPDQDPGVLITEPSMINPTGGRVML